MKPKVLFILNSYLGYSETFTYNILKTIKQIEPVLYVKNIENTDRFPLSWKIYKHPPVNKPVFKKFFTLKAIQDDILEVCEKEQIDVILAGSADLSILAKKAVIVKKVPLIARCVGADIYARYRNRKHRSTLRSIFKHVSHFVCVSHHIKYFIAQHYNIPKDRISVIYHGLDLSVFSFTHQENYPKNPKVIMIGRFVEKKGMEYGIKAFAKAVEKYPELKLEIIGDGRLYDKYVSLISSLKVQESVIFLGKMNSEEIANWLMSSTLLLAPHVTAPSGDSEGIPNTVKEAMAVGVPVVATRHTGIPEIIKHEYSGLIYEEKDIDGLADGMIRYLEDFSLYSSCRNNARRIIETEFDCKKQVARLEELLKEVINEKHSNNIA